jgi:GTP pyrophosphokinase
MPFERTRFTREEYDEVLRLLDVRRAQKTNVITNAIEELRSAINRAGVSAEITGAEETPLSALLKINNRNMEYFHELEMDELTVVVDNIATCYQILGVVHTI